jgi:hypothetical protein
VRYDLQSCFMRTLALLNPDNGKHLTAKKSMPAFHAAKLWPIIETQE